MARNPRSTRRDPRYPLPAGTSFINLGPSAPSGAEPWITLTRVSVSGLAFEIDGTELQPGARLDGCRVRIGSCGVTGDLIIRNLRETGAQRTEIGCLFFPSSPQAEERWAALLAGVEVAQPVAARGGSS